MLFTDPCFLFLFLPLILGLYYLSPASLKNITLLAASVLFYAAGDLDATVLILFSILFNFWAGLLIGTQQGIPGRKAALALGIAVNLALLIYFKYAMFLVRNLNMRLPITR